MNNNRNISTFSPFITFCQHVIPLAYDESMSYYETLCALRDYLLNKVIPAVNNNADAVTELQNAFNTLQNYVDNYFNSTDFSQKINDKLDEMATDGTLKSLLEEIINDTYEFTFNSFNEMINYNLPLNANVHVLGYDEANDGGESYYKITNNAVDNIYNYKLNNNLTATKLVKQETNILSFGIKPLNILDEKINTILKNENKVIFNEGTYLISAEFRINPNNVELKGNNSIIKINGAYDVDYYAMFDLQDCSNVIIDNFIIDGSKSNSVQESGTGGQCIVIGNNTKNILIKNCELKNSWYDGITIDLYTNNLDNNCTIENCIFTSNGRNGISVLSCDNVIIKNCLFQNINGDKLPQSAIDIEPYTGNNPILNNIKIYNY